MKPKYIYPDLFLQKVGELTVSTGHPAQQKLPEENWKPLGKQALKRIPVKNLSENKPQLFIDSEFGRIDYVRTGTQGKPVLFMIPGFPDCWYTFHQVIPLLANDFDIITYSPPGHGYSTYTDAFDFNIDTYTLVARMMIQRFGLQHFHICGHSIGGEQAIRTALQLKSREIIKKHYPH